jgi:hypothetical protein
MPLVFDIETNGYLEETNRVHVLVIKDTSTGGNRVTYNNQAGAIRQG